MVKCFYFRFDDRVDNSIQVRISDIGKQSITLKHDIESVYFFNCKNLVLYEMCVNRELSVSTDFRCTELSVFV